MRVAIYVRFSEAELQRATSAEDQLRECRAYAARQGWTVAAEYVDRGVRAGNRAARRELARLLADAKGGTFAVVLVFDLSRWSRDGLQGMTDLAALRDAEVKLADTRSGLIDTASPAGFMAAAFGFGSAQQENVARANNSRRGQAGQVGRGFIAGGKVYGFTSVPVMEGAKRIGVRLEPSPAEADVVRRIFAEFDSGLSYYAIGERLTREGVRSPRGAATWPNTSVRAILTNPKYKGWGVYGETQRSGRVSAATGKKAQRATEGAAVVNKEFCAPIVDAALWDRVNARLAEAAHKARAGERAPRRKTLLTGLLRCATCGDRFEAANATQLRCRSYRTCANTRRPPKAEVEALVLRVAEAATKDPKALAPIIEAHNRNVDAANAAQTSALDALGEQVAATERAIANLMIALEGSPTSKAIPAQLAKREAELAELVVRRDVAARAVAPRLLPKVDPEALAAGDGPLFVGDVERDRSVLLRLVRQVDILDDGPIIVRFKAGEVVTGLDGAYAEPDGGPEIWFDESGEEVEPVAQSTKKRNATSPRGFEPRLPA